LAFDLIIGSLEDHLHQFAAPACVGTAVFVVVSTEE